MTNIEANMLSPIKELEEQQEQLHSETEYNLSKKSNAKKISKLKSSKKELVKVQLKLSEIKESDNITDDKLLPENAPSLEKSGKQLLNGPVREIFEETLEEFLNKPNPSGLSSPKSKSVTKTMPIKLSPSKVPSADKSAKQLVKKPLKEMPQKKHTKQILEEQTNLSDNDAQIKESINETDKNKDTSIFLQYESDENKNINKKIIEQNVEQKQNKLDENEQSKNKNEKQNIEQPINLSEYNIQIKSAIYESHDNKDTSVLQKNLSDGNKHLKKKNRKQILEQPINSPDNKTEINALINEPDKSKEISILYKNVSDENKNFKKKSRKQIVEQPINLSENDTQIKPSINEKYINNKETPTFLKSGSDKNKNLNKKIIEQNVEPKQSPNTLITKLIKESEKNKKNSTFLKNEEEILGQPINLTDNTRITASTNESHKNRDTSIFVRNESGENRHTTILLKDESNNNQYMKGSSFKIPTKKDAKKPSKKLNEKYQLIPLKEPAQGLLNYSVNSIQTLPNVKPQDTVKETLQQLIYKPLYELVKELQTAPKLESFKDLVINIPPKDFVKQLNSIPEKMMPSWSREEPQISKPVEVVSIEESVSEIEEAPIFYRKKVRQPKTEPIKKLVSKTEMEKTQNNRKRNKPVETTVKVCQTIPDYLQTDELEQESVRYIVIPTESEKGIQTVPENGPIDRPIQRAEYPSLIGPLPLATTHVKGCAMTVIIRKVAQDSDASLPQGESRLSPRTKKSFRKPQT